MARTRDINPKFFANEDLAGLPMAARLLFVGLWCWADREGRLEDRPLRIETDIFRYDRRIKAEPFLKALAAQNFIIRYEVEGRKLIWIPGFKKYQRVHPNEALSVLPCHPDEAILLASRGDPLVHQGDPLVHQGDPKVNQGSPDTKSRRYVASVDYQGDPKDEGRHTKMSSFSEPSLSSSTSVPSYSSGVSPSRQAPHRANARKIGGEMADEILKRNGFKEKA